MGGLLCGVPIPAPLLTAPLPSARAPELFPEGAQRMQQLASKVGLNPSQGVLLPKSGERGPAWTTAAQRPADPGGPAHTSWRPRPSWRPRHPGGPAAGREGREPHPSGDPAQELEPAVLALVPGAWRDRAGHLPGNQPTAWAEVRPERGGSFGGRTRRRSGFLESPSDPRRQARGADLQLPENETPDPRPCCCCLAGLPGSGPLWAPQGRDLSRLPLPQPDTYPAETGNREDGLEIAYERGLTVGRAGGPPLQQALDPCPPRSLPPPGSPGGVWCEEMQPALTLWTREGPRPWRLPRAQSCMPLSGHKGAALSQLPTRCQGCTGHGQRATPQPTTGPWIPSQESNGQRPEVANKGPLR
nr:proline-rich protein 2-like [Bubalus bubalis]